jgi:hypothetical protein
MNRLMKTILIVTLLLIVGGMLVAPVSAATTWINTSKYADNNYSSVINWANLTYQEMNATLPKAYSNGPVYMQGPTFDPADPYGVAGQNMINFYGHNGTYIRNLTDLAGGMAAGDELKIQSSDNFAVYFGADDVNTPEANQGNLIVSWWDSEMGLVPGYYYGMRLFFYNPQSTYGFNDDLNLTLVEMRDNFDPWYQSNYSLIWPSAKGLSSKYVQYLKIYPPHRYDFNATGDTTEWAYEGGITGVPETATEPSNAFSGTTDIEDDDGYSYSTDSMNIGEYASQRIVFSIIENANNIEKLAFTWDGSSSHDNPGADQGATTYIWRDGIGYVTFSGDITSEIGDYIVTGNVTVLLKQNAAQFYDEEEMEYKFSHLETDYAKLVVTHHHTN